MVAAAGSIEVGRQYIRIQPTGELKSIEEIGDVLILQPGKERTKLYLKDIANIRRGYQEPPTAIVSFNGMPAIGLGISTVEGGNVVTMGQALDQRLNELEADTPIGMEIGTISHQAESVTTAINWRMVFNADS